MSDALAALRDGVRRVNRAPAVLFGVWALTLAVTLPAAAVMGRAIARDLGHSLAADTAADGVNYEWMQEFAARGGGFASTLQPTVIGVAAVLDNLSALADNTPRPAPILAMAAAYAVLWLFLAGGIIDRYARDRATRAFGFFGACGVLFFRFLRLALVQVVVYGLLFGVLHPRLSAYTASAPARLAFYVVFGALVAGANLVFDYAKVRAVIEDRHSMVGALGAALGFVRRHAAAAVTLYVLDVLLFVAAVIAYGVLAPGVGRGALVWVGVAMGGSFLAVRLWVKLTFWASEAALFQMQLAHAGYVARPEPVWPESPAAEAIG